MRRPAILAACAAFTLTACGGDEENTRTSGATADSSQEERIQREVGVLTPYLDITMMCSEAIQTGELDRVLLALKVDQLVEATNRPDLGPSDVENIQLAADVLKGCDDEQALRLARAIDRL